MKTQIIKKTQDNHKFVCSLYQVSKCEKENLRGYDVKVLADNGVNPFLDVVEVVFEEDQPLVHSIFICHKGKDLEETQLIFVY